ncbi:MAG: aminopeptidase [Saprospiraceae bacterium]|nr:MAG: aminopeptidase [Saprospiraceae bacterium]
MRFSLFLLSCAILLGACKTQQVVIPADNSVFTENRDLDTMVISAPRIQNPSEIEGTLGNTYTLEPYNPSHTRTNDLIHTRLDLRFDWANEKVMGKATLQLKPYFYATDQVVLDAKNFEFKNVLLKESGKELKYDYDGIQITIHLDKKYNRETTYTLEIDYIASPSATGGSAAITSDKGLFFINPKGEDPEKPQQIWTQGETENNSRWFPTFDKPNERCTQEMYVTVEDRFKTLSNGIMVSSKSNGDGTRTDYWKMDQPHAPYLFMLAIGEYAVVKEEWEGIPLAYYVEPEYKTDAKAIFAHTPEMLSFFSEKLGIKYPWSKFAQVVVRDYVSGAMENTTAVIFGEFVQKKERELIDNNNDRIVAHEMFHHWFGDYVTCESWANLTLNEGFANYSEYLWFEHKYGADAADYHLLEEWGGYINTSRGSMHPLIDFGYHDKEDMFDAHSYNKGGAVLHMLRNYLGDDAFWAGLNKYLTDNAHTAVEVHNLRLAFEAVSGQDLNWFFNQWYLSEGHPDLVIDHEYDETTKSITVTIEQVQDGEEVPPIFQLPTTIDIYLSPDEKLSKQVMINQRIQTFTFEAPSEPKLINFDADKALLAERQENKSTEELVFQYYNAPKFLDRFESIQKLYESEDPEVQAMIHDALEDPFWVIRATALSTLESEVSDEDLVVLRKMAANDSHSEVKATAFQLLTYVEDVASLKLAKQAIESEKAYPVIGAALGLIQAVAPAEAGSYAKKLEKEDNEYIKDAVAGIYVESGDTKYLPFFEENLNKIDGFSAISFYENYQSLAVKGGLDQAKSAAGKLKIIAINMEQSPWKRAAATKAIHSLKTELEEQSMDAENAEKSNLEAVVEELDTVLQFILKTETNEQLKLFYQQM